MTTDHEQIIELQNMATELGNLLYRALPTLDDEHIRYSDMAKTDPAWTKVAEAFALQSRETRAALVKHGFLSK